MSPEWPWPIVLALVVPPALGHLYHFVLLVNTTSALGYREPTVDKVRDCLFGILAISSVALLWLHLCAPWWTWGGLFGAYAWLCAISGVVIAPFNSWRVVSRRQPDGIAGRSVAIDLAESAGRDALIGPGRGARLLRLPGNESLQLQLCEWDVEFRDLHPPLDGLRIVQITDLHIAPCYERRFFEAVLSHCADWQADVIVMTGDLVEHDETIAWVESLLSTLEARLGKFAILGNHDTEHQPRIIAAELARAGFQMLEGRWATVEVDGATLAIGGTSEPWGPAISAADMPMADFRLLLSHSPDVFTKAQRMGTNLMLSGHNHGGQIRFPLVGPIFMPSRYSRRFDQGFFRKNGTLLYVNRGVGGKHPVRYGCPPEITRFVLKPAANSRVASTETGAGRRSVKRESAQR